VTGTQVRRIRQALGLTQLEFAKRLGVHAVTVAKWETDAQGMRGPAARLIMLLGENATPANTKNPRPPRPSRRIRDARSGSRKKR
jgi:DNA-binding transcriptional regulator YiaG